MKVVIIGTGNVAHHLAPAIYNAGHNILQVYSRNRSKVKRLAAKVAASPVFNITEIDTSADLILLLVSDHSIEEVAGSLAKSNAVLVHASGSVALKSIQKRHKNSGVLYPLQSFSLDKKIDIAKIPFCLESSNTTAKKKLVVLCKSLKGSIHWLDSKQRGILHLSAVFANNFTNQMYIIAEKLLSRHKIKFDLLRPLILETALKVQQHSPVSMQTGPAIRRDERTLKEHRRLLARDKHYRKLYDLVSAEIIRQ